MGLLNMWTIIAELIEAATHPADFLRIILQPASDCLAAALFILLTHSG
jgi:hypothetical protein